MKNIFAIAALAFGLAACGGQELPAEESSPVTHPDLVAQLGIPCDLGRPVQCDVHLVCGNDRFGTTCTAYCTKEPCSDPGTVCLPRAGTEPGSGIVGFCWKMCGSDADCSAPLHCRAEGVCGP